MKHALMGKVLCASCKIERRSNVIQRLFNSSDIIAKSNFFFPERCTARVSWGIIVSSPEPSSMISFVVGMSNNFSLKHPRVVCTNSVSPQLKFIRWSTTKRVDSLSKRKKTNSEASFFRFSIIEFAMPPFKARLIFFRCYVLDKRITGV